LREAIAGLEAEKLGLMRPPIRRGPADMDFYDADGRPFEIKAPPSPPGREWKFKVKKAGDSILDELRKPSYPNGNTGRPGPVRVIMDSTYMKKADHLALWKYLKDNGTPGELARIFEINVKLD
jgi:hypothetical protein